jgi:hypothetical protein
MNTNVIVKKHDGGIKSVASWLVEVAGNLVVRPIKIKLIGGGSTATKFDPMFGL